LADAIKMGEMTNECGPRFGLAEPRGLAVRGARFIRRSGSILHRFNAIVTDSDGGRGVLDDAYARTRNQVYECC